MPDFNSPINGWDRLCTSGKETTQKKKMPAYLIVKEGILKMLSIEFSGQQLSCQ